MDHSTIAAFRAQALSCSVNNSRYKYEVMREVHNDCGTSFFLSLIFLSLLFSLFSVYIFVIMSLAGGQELGPPTNPPPPDLFSSSSFGVFSNKKFQNVHKV